MTRPKAVLLEFIVACTFLLASVPANGATISGSLFTAEHEDSVAVDTAVSLVFRGAGEEIQRLSATSDAHGHFHFMDLSADTSIAYILKIQYKGSEFLSAPIHFEPGQEELEFPVLLGGGMPPQGEMPAGHPPVGGTPVQGKPVAPNALHTLLVVLVIVLVFAGIAAVAAHGRPHGSKAAAMPSPVRDLIRDIASLDNRHADRVIGEDEYRMVRAGLMQRLQQLTGGTAIPSGGRSKG